MSPRTIKLMFLLQVLLISTSACSKELPSEDSTATPDSIYLTAEAIQTNAANPTETAEPLPPATFTPTTTLMATSTHPAPVTFGGQQDPVVSCDTAGFVEDVTIPDGTEVAAGTVFTKTWQLRNDGTCTWDSSYLLIFSYGDQMSGPDSASFTSESIAPGETVDISVELTAPDETGTAAGYWMLQNADGGSFGISSSAYPFYVEIEVTDAEATSTPTPTSTDSGSEATNTPTETSATETTAPTETDLPTETFTPEPDSTETPTEETEPTATFTSEAETGGEDSSEDGSDSS